MGSRLELHEEICNVLGSRNAYFQSPGKDRMKYPAVVYRISRVNLRRADNKNYNTLKCYNLIVIDSDPDSDIWLDLIKNFKYCTFDGFYVSDNLNHWSLILYY